MKTTVVYHRADFDGIFCREIARKFLPDAELIGWDFGDSPIAIDLNETERVYVLDLPIDRIFELRFPIPQARDNYAHGFWEVLKHKLIWIDHHKSSIETHPADIPGYRIDGVAACRLAWQWFRRRESFHNPTIDVTSLPPKQEFIDRTVSEPVAVRLAGEYDIWDKRDPNAELFQSGLRSQELNSFHWETLLSFNSSSQVYKTSDFVEELLEKGKAIKFARDREYREVITEQGFDLQFEGLTFLACNSHELDIRSQLFEAGIKPHHDALLGFTFHGKGWRVSMYHIKGKEKVDLLSIAKHYGGGGHAGACGFDYPSMLPPFPLLPSTAPATIY